MGAKSAHSSTRPSGRVRIETEEVAQFRAALMCSTRPPGRGRIEAQRIRVSVREPLSGSPVGASQVDHVEAGNGRFERDGFDMGGAELGEFVADFGQR